jgi:hypothetical protein
VSKLVKPNQNVDGRGLKRKEVIARFKIGEINYRFFSDGTMETSWLGRVINHKGEVK